VTRVYTAAQGARRKAALRAIVLSLLASTSGLAHAADDTTPAPGTTPTDADGPTGGIIVSGRLEKKQVESGALGARSLLETPFSVAAVNEDAIKRIAATTIDAAFNYDASIRSNNSGVASGNTFSSRGIAIDRTNGYKLDGLPFPYWFQDHPIEHLQQVEVLKGAGGFAYGFAAPGGVVNFVSKKPTDTFEANFGLSFRSSALWRAHLDLGGPLDAAGTTRFRFNAVNEQGTLYNGAHNKNQFFSLALDGKITDRLSWAVDGFYQRTLQTGQSNSIAFTTAVTSLAPTGGKLNLGAAGSSKFNDVPILTGKLKYDVSDNWKATLSARYAVIDERFPGNTLQIINNAGDYRSIAFNMNRIFWYYVFQAGVEGKFNTGPVEHQIVAGANSTTVNFDFDNPTRQVLIGTGNIYNPNFVPAITGNAGALYNHRPPVWTRFQNIRQKALYVSDTADWGPVSLLVGARYTDYEEQNFGATAKETSYFQYKPLSPIYSLTYKIAPAIRAYVTYVEALNRGGLAAATTNNPNASFGPLKATQYEAGLKADGHWGNASLALFKIKLPSEYVNSANYFIRDGFAQHQGAEINLGLTPTRDLFLGLSAAWLDAVQKSGNPALVGKKIAGTTGFQASALAEYTVADGLKVNGGIRYSGKAYGQADNSFIFPASTVLDLGTSYAFEAEGRPVTLRFNLQNLSDEKYWIPAASGTGLSAAAPRTFSLSADFALNRRSGLAPRKLEQGGVPPRSGHAYLGLEAGTIFPEGFSATGINHVTNTTAAPVANALYVRQKTGWDVDGVLGYDFGRFRAEVEAGFKRTRLKSVAYNDASAPIDGTSVVAGQASSPVGQYDRAGGATQVLSVLANGLVNIGQRDARIGGFIGGGVGLARVTTGRWTLNRDVAPLTATATPTYFSDDNVTTFAWQALAGLRHRLGQHSDLTLKYRYFTVPDVTFFTSNGNQVEGKLSSHSLLFGINFNL
jgi:iron complex outermembrane receptor protein